MKRRDVLSVSSATALSLAGCISIGSNDCLGETWTGLGYDVLLHDITTDDATGRWEGRCSLSVDLSFVHGNDPGITGAGVALYSRDGHRIGLVPLGDMTWTKVPAEDRTEMDCGGYQRGGLRRDGEFAVNEFPYYLGLWYAEIRAGAPEGRSELEYEGEIPPESDVGPRKWESVGRESPGAFPPVPDASPELGGAVTDGTVTAFSRECDGEAVRTTDVYCCDVGISGGIETADPHYVPGLQRATTKDDGETGLVEIAARDYRRPPTISCETTYIQYTVGLSFAGRPPSSFEVVHVDAEGTERGRTTVTR